jgi:hypothetical protein
MLPACTPTQKVYSITGFGETFTGDSPSGLCKSILGSDFKDATAHTCYAQTYGNFPIVKVCDDSPQFTLEKQGQISELWLLFLAAGIVILCLRKLADLFNTSPNEKS